MIFHAHDVEDCYGSCLEEKLTDGLEPCRKKWHAACWKGYGLKPKQDIIYPNDGVLEKQLGIKQLVF